MMRDPLSITDNVRFNNHVTAGVTLTERGGTRISSAKRDLDNKRAEEEQYYWIHLVCVPFTRRPSNQPTVVTSALNQTNQAHCTIVGSSR